MSEEVIDRVFKTAIQNKKQLATRILGWQRITYQKVKVWVLQSVAIEKYYRAAADQLL